MINRGMHFVPDNTDRMKLTDPVYCYLIKCSLTMKMAGKWRRPGDRQATPVPLPAVSGGPFGWWLVGPWCRGGFRLWFGWVGIG